MINTIFSFFIFVFLARIFIQRGRFAVWIFLSVLAFAQVSQPTLWAILGLLLVQEAVVLVFRGRNVPFLPLAYAAMLISVHHLFKGHITGFSYLVLSSSIDIWLRVKGDEIVFRERLLNLMSFPKTLVGPITSAKEHRPAQVDLERLSKVALIGLLKVFVLVNLWRQYVPAPVWESLSQPHEYLWFGFWNYVHLYLEFSGACDLVAAAFWAFGFGCPLNFDRPYLSLSVTEFWKRWHITLGLWIKNFVFIPLGGSRVSQPRILLNLMLAMTLSGAWHGLSKGFIAWGFLQGLFLCIERVVRLEERLRVAGPATRALSWAVTQFLVTLSWILFFARF